jgi:putative flippase GtrA
VVNSAILWLLHSRLGVYYVAASAVATECAIVSNFLGHEFVTFGDERRAAGAGARFVRYQAISLLTLVGTVGLLAALVQIGGEARLLVWNVIAIGVMFLVNFGANRLVTWRAPGVAAE